MIDLATLTAAKEKLFSRTVKYPNGCWIWCGGMNDTAYGTLWIRLNGELQQWRTHRLSYFLHNGSIPDGLFVCHHCDNPPCINPDHLFVGTTKDNLYDAIRKGRWTEKHCLQNLLLVKNRAVGERHPQAKLTDADVRQIRLRLASGESQRAIAWSYKLRSTAIWKIAKKKTWSHVSD